MAASICNLVHHDQCLYVREGGRLLVLEMWWSCTCLHLWCNNPFSQVMRCKVFRCRATPFPTLAAATTSYDMGGAATCQKLRCLPNKALPKLFSRHA